jgi:hypothetical protein
MACGGTALAAFLSRLNKWSRNHSTHGPVKAQLAEFCETPDEKQWSSNISIRY